MEEYVISRQEIRQWCAIPMEQLAEHPDRKMELRLRQEKKQINREIADALKAQSGISLDKRKIVIADVIKTVGTYTVTCKLGYEITAPLTVKIEEE